MTADEVRVCLALAVAEVGGMKTFAKRYCINAGNLRQVLAGDRSPQPEHLALLGMCRRVVYEQLRSPQCCL